MIVEDEIEIGVQVNGKLRGSIKIDKGLSNEEIENIAKNEENVQKHIEGKDIVNLKTINDSYGKNLEVAVSDELYSLLKQGVEYTKLTNGYFNILSGGLTVIIWDYIPLVAGQTLGTVTGLYSLAIGFLISIVLIVVVSLCTKAPDASIVAEFERVASDEEI